MVKHYFLALLLALGCGPALANVAPDVYSLRLQTEAGTVVKKLVE